MVFERQSGNGLMGFSENACLQRAAVGAQIVPTSVVADQHGMDYHVIERLLNARTMCWARLSAVATRVSVR
jgi:hypothetical protein